MIFGLRAYDITDGVWRLGSWTYLRYKAMAGSVWLGTTDSRTVKSVAGQWQFSSHCNVTVVR